MRNKQSIPTILLGGEAVSYVTDDSADAARAALEARKLGLSARRFKTAQGRIEIRVVRP